jgi:hypothetical protein
LGAAQTALGAPCGGFSIVPANHVLVKYSASLPVGAARSTPLVSISGNAISVTRTVSGGSISDESCVDDTIDLGYPGPGRFDLTWSDDSNFTSQRSSFTFFVGASSSGWSSLDALAIPEMEVLPPLFPDQPVRMQVLGCSGRPPVAYVSGTDVEVSTENSGSDCKVSLIDTGVLGEGDYKVTLTFVPKPNVYPPSKTLRFVVQRPAASSACGGVTSVTRTPNATARLHFEDPYYGYAPAFGLPSMTGVAGPGGFEYTVMVVQPVADIANPWGWGAAQPSTTCHAEDIDLGPLDHGYHLVQWWKPLTVNGVKTEFEGSGNLFDFWWQDGDVLCTRTPRLLTSSAVEGAPFDLSARILGIGVWGAGATVSGRTITVESTGYYWGANPPPPPECQTYQARVGALQAGEYTIVWHAPNAVVTGHLTVVKEPRRRAAGH